MMFKKVLIDLILQGKKTMTSRSKPLYKVGVTTNLMADRDYSKISGKYLKITKVYKKALNEFTDKDANKEGFKDLLEFKKYWKENIGEWTPNIEVWVHEFDVVKSQTTA
jgi:hypothetical protein